jgi:hypothetical protein
MSAEMSTSFEFNDKMSLFIPRISSGISRGHIMRVFIDLRIGHVIRIDFVWKNDRNGQRYKSAYIHFLEWFDTTATRNLQERVLSPEKEARIVYDDPWFWIVLPNTSSRNAEVKLADMTPPQIQQRLIEVETEIEAFERRFEYLQAEKYSLSNELNTKMHYWPTTQSEDQEQDALEEQLYREQYELEREQAEKERAEYDRYESEF